MTIFAEINNSRAYKNNALIFFVSRLISDLASSMFGFALSLYVLDITGSATLFSVIMGFSIFPKVIVNIFAGVYVDKHDKKKLVVLFDFISGLATFIFWGIFQMHAKSIPLMTVFQVVLSALAAMFLLALNSSIPNLCRKENVSRFNSMSMVIMAIVSLGGPVLGGIVYRDFGIFTVTLINGVTFFISFLLEIFLRYNRTVANTKKNSYFESLRSVWGYLKGEKVMQYLLLSVVIINFILSPLVTLVLQYVSYHELKVSSFQVSLIQASWFFGIIIGAALVSVIKSTYRLLQKFLLFVQVQALLIVLWAIFRLPFFTVAGSSSWRTAGIFCALMIITGTFNGFTSIPAMSYMQTDTPEAILGGITGVVNTACQIAQPAGMWIYGILLSNVSWVYATTIPGILLFLFAGFVNSKINLKVYFDRKKVEKQSFRT